MKFGRRRFLATSLRAVARRARRLLVRRRRRRRAARTATPARATAPVEEVQQLAYVPFRGAHQAGITHAQNAQGLLAALTVTSRDRADLVDIFQTLVDRDRAADGGPAATRTATRPTRRCTPAPSATRRRRPTSPSSCPSAPACSTSASASPTACPRELVTMPFLANDKLDPARSHGDLLLTISSYHEDLNLFALRQLMRATRRHLVLEWMIDGYNRRTARRRCPGAGRGAQPDGVRRRHRQPDHRRRRAGSLRLDRRRRRRAGVGGRRQLPRGAGDPDVRRVLGPHPARRSRRR